MVACQGCTRSLTRNYFSSRRRSRSINKSHEGDRMKIATVISRVLLGLGFVIFGLNILHPFLNAPPPPEGSLAAQFMVVMVPSHWMALAGIVQLVCGLLVLAGPTTPFGLVP